MADSNVAPAWFDWKTASGTTILAGVILANFQGLWVSGTTYQEKVVEVKELKEKVEKLNDLLLKTIRVAEAPSIPVFGQAFPPTTENSPLEEVRAEMDKLNREKISD